MSAAQTTDRCPSCGREGVPVHGKIVCPKCHILLANCCGD